MLRTNEVFVATPLPCFILVMTHQHLLRGRSIPQLLSDIVFFRLAYAWDFRLQALGISVLGFESHGVGGILSHELDWCIYSGVLGVKPPALLRVLKSMLLLLKLYLTKR